MDNITLLNRLFKKHSIKAEIVNKVDGVTFTRYEAKIDPFSFKAEKLMALEDNIAHLLRSPTLPITFPIYERSIVALDIPNKERRTVDLKTVLASTKGIEEFKLPIILGYTVYNEPFVVDLADAPHILIAGTTGSGKSVGLRSIITGLLHFIHDIEIYMIDPKCVEMLAFEKYEQTEVITDIDEVQEVLDFLQFRVEDRYYRLKEQGVTNIADAKDMPYIVLVIDELADLFARNKNTKDDILKIIQKSRAAGIHLIAATQRPSVDTVSGIIKSNFPTRIAFRVSSYEDSRVILGSAGAEKLLGDGDMLYRKQAGSFERVQGAYITDNEIKTILG